MAKPGKVFDRVMEGRGAISFRDFERLLLALGFKHDRTSGSHRIYVHPKVTRPLSVQPRGNDAKPYQVRQLRGMIEEFALRLWSCGIMYYAIIVFWSDEDSAWVADVPDLKSCSAFGDTPEEAVAEVRMAMEAWLAAASEAGHPIPEARYRPRHEAAE